MLLFLSIKLSDHIIWILQYGSLCNISSLSVVQWFVVFHIQAFISLWILPAAVMVSEWIPSRLIALLFHRLHTWQRAAAMLERQPLLWVLIALSSTFLPSVLSHCWFSVRKSIHPVKIEWWGVFVVVCLAQGPDCLHMVQLMPLHSKTLSSLASFKSWLDLPIQTVFIFLVPVYSHCPGEETVKRV